MTMLADRPIEQEPPHHLEVETALLGAVLRSRDALAMVHDRVEAAYFYSPEHQRIWEGIEYLVDRGSDVNATNLARWADGDGLLSEVGGGKYLYTLMANVVTVINVRDYAETVADYWRRREAISVLGRTVDDLYNPDLGYSDRRSSAQVIEEAEAALAAVVDHGQTVAAVQSAPAAVELAMASLEAAYRNRSEVTGVPTGIDGLDRITAGLQNANMIVVAGRPSMGKTAFGAGIAFATAARIHHQNTMGGDLAGGCVYMVSAENSADLCIKEQLSRMTGIPKQEQQRGTIVQEEFDALHGAAEQVGHWPIYIDDSPDLTPARIKARVARKHRRQPVRMILVDYLQLLREPVFRGDPVHEVGELSKSMKSMAKHFNCPVVVISQLSRKVEGREDKRPQMSDLRESGQIEQDADLILFPFREEYYLAKEEPQQKANEADGLFLERRDRWMRRLEDRRGRVELIVAKNRHGPTGSAECRFEGHALRFSDFQDPERPDPVARRRVDERNAEEEKERQKGSKP